MFAALFILFMISLVIFGSIFVFMTLRHHHQLKQRSGEIESGQSKLVKPTEEK